MAGMEWRGRELYLLIVAGTQRGMSRALADGSEAARPPSRVRTGRYRAGWQASQPVLDGTTVKGEIFNEAANTSGGFYSRYVSAGTSRMSGDFAHAAALDTAASRLVPYIAEEIGLR